MFQIDDAFLNSLGLGALPQNEKETMKRQIYEALEMRVGMTLASNMTEAQLDEFEALMNKNDEEGALRWLETNFPNYRQVVAEELEKLKGEVKVAAPQILAEVQAAAQGQPAQAGQVAPTQTGQAMAPPQQQAQPGTLPAQPGYDQYGYGQPAPGQPGPASYPGQPPATQPGGYPQQPQPPQPPQPPVEQ